MPKQKVQKFFKSWKSTIKTLTKKPDLDLKQIQDQVGEFVQSVEKDVRLMVGQNVPKLVKKLKIEHKRLEKNIDQTIRKEMGKAKNLVLEKKSQLEKLQHKIEREFSRLRGQAAKKKKKTSRKKATKKTTKKTTKKATKKTTKKKVPSARGKSSL